MSNELLSEVKAELRRVQEETIDVCIEIVESLRWDSQGLILDAATIDACASILRNTLEARRPPQVNNG